MLHDSKISPRGPPGPGARRELDPPTGKSNRGKKYGNMKEASRLSYMHAHGAFTCPPLKCKHALTQAGIGQRTETNTKEGVDRTKIVTVGRNVRVCQ